jgi:hypothetical protein
MATDLITFILHCCLLIHLFFTTIKLIAVVLCCYLWINSHGKNAMSQVLVTFALMTIGLITFEKLCFMTVQQIAFLRLSFDL